MKKIYSKPISYIVSLNLKGKVMDDKVLPAISQYRPPEEALAKEVDYSSFDDEEFTFDDSLNYKQFGPNWDY